MERRTEGQQTMDNRTINARVIGGQLLMIKMSKIEGNKMVWRTTDSRERDNLLRADG